MTARLWRLFWLSVLVAHILAAAGWWTLQPGGFRTEHPRFWSNRAAPLAVLGLALATLKALSQERMSALRLLLPAWPAAWAAAAVSAQLVFPISFAGLWYVPMGGAAAMGLAAIPPWRHSHARAGAAAMVMALGAAAVASALIWTQRVPGAATHPLNLPLAALATPSSHASPAPGAFRLGTGVMVQTSDGSIAVSLQPLTFTVQPLLSFLSQSPDGCPTVFVPESVRDGALPRLRNWVRAGERSCALRYDLRGQGPATLAVTAMAGQSAVAVEAMTRLVRPIFSHLNSFCDFEVRGHRRLALEFSPCPGVPIDVQPFDYPAGRPVRFAFVTADRTFRVVEASSGEKGPFRALARGRLASGQELAIAILDQGRPVARIALTGLVGTGGHDALAHGGIRCSCKCDRVQPGRGITFVAGINLRDAGGDLRRARVGLRGPCRRDVPEPDPHRGGDLRRRVLG